MPTRARTRDFLKEHNVDLLTVRDPDQKSIVPPVLAVLVVIMPLHRLPADCFAPPRCRADRTRAGRSSLDQKKSTSIAQTPTRQLTPTRSADALPPPGLYHFHYLAESGVLLSAQPIHTSSPARWPILGGSQRQGYLATPGPCWRLSAGAVPSVRDSMDAEILLATARGCERQTASPGHAEGFRGAGCVTSLSCQ